MNKVQRQEIINAAVKHGREEVKNNLEYLMHNNRGRHYSFLLEKQEIKGFNNRPTYVYQNIIEMQMHPKEVIFVRMDGARNKVPYCRIHRVFNVRFV